MASPAEGHETESKPKTVNNIADIIKPMWRGFAKKPQWRCLVPASHFCEAEGQKGRMTRTWLHKRAEPIFAWATLWRVSDEWSPFYPCAMTDYNETVRPIHTRMPVILRRDEWDVWLRGTFEDMRALQERCYPDDPIGFERTDDPWFRRKTSEPPLEAPNGLTPWTRAG